MPLIQSVQYQEKCFHLLDLRALHPSGNKAFKLEQNIRAAISEGAERILSFGGPWSNHIHALAAKGKELGIPTVGVIRGERPKNLSATLVDAMSCDMQLHFVSREDYRNASKEAFLITLRQRFGDFFLVPEGGSNELGVAGAKEIAGLFEHGNYDRIFLPVGSGGTLAGLALGVDLEVVGISVLKGEGDLRDRVAEMTGDKSNWWIDHSGHYGGYGKCSADLKRFILDFEQACGVTLDPVYTGKMIRRMLELMDLDASLNSERTLAVHTGGMQGRRGFGF